LIKDHQQTDETPRSSNKLLKQTRCRVPEEDLVNTNGRRCINFVRSVCGMSTDCVPGPIEQVCPLPFLVAFDEHFT